jgi:hypothetical protein
MTTQSLASHLYTSTGPLSHHATRLLRARALFSNAAPALAGHARVANYRLGRLIIHADNNAVANKLKQLAPTLTEALRGQFPDITEIAVSTQPRNAPPLQHQQSAQKEPSVGIDKSTKDKLSGFMDQLPADAPLREALQRLIRNC